MRLRHERDTAIAIVGVRPRPDLVMFAAEIRRTSFSKPVLAQKKGGGAGRGDWPSSAIDVVVGPMLRPLGDDTWSVIF